MSKWKILLIDDEPVFTRVMRDYLEETGRFEVRMENDPTTAVAVARAFRPDLILLDVIMPEMDGGDLAFQLKSERTLKDVPIVFLTAIVSKEDTPGQGKMIAGHPFLAKPVEAQDLIACVERELKAA